MSDVVVMADEKHTPGPWIAASSPSSIVGWPIVGPRGRAVASVHCLRGNTPEGKAVNAEAGANARLIAAAPDLLTLAYQYAAECATCAGMGKVETLSASGHPAGKVDCEDCADIRKVIAKAEGRS